MKATMPLLLVLAGLLITPATILADNSAPTIAITAPEEGFTIAADTVDVAVDYAAPSGCTITRVAFLVNGEAVQVVDLDPAQESGVHSFLWGTAGYQDGGHQVTVEAVDSEGRTATKTIFVLLQRGLLDLSTALHISSPKHGQTVSGATPVQVAGDPDQRVRYVIFLVDSVFKAVSNVRPFSYRWDTTRYLNGLHRLQVRAYQEDGFDYLSPAIEVRVDNPSGATTMRPAQEKPVAPAAAPAASAAPARAGSPVLPPPMRTESPTYEARLVEVAEPEVVRPGTAPFVSPSGDLVRLPSADAAGRSPEVASLQIASLPIGAAEDYTARATASPAVAEPPAPVALARTAGEPTLSPAAAPLPGPATMDTLPPAEQGPETAPIGLAEVPVPGPEAVGEPLHSAAESAVSTSSPSEPVPAAQRPPEVATTQIAALPTPVVEIAPLQPPAKAVMAEAKPKSAVTPEHPAAPERPLALGKQIAMLPPLPEAPAPAPRLAPEPPLPTGTHTVRQGDCLWGIAAQYGLSPAELAAANALVNPSIIYPGQQLKVVGVRLYYDGKPVIADAPAITVKGRTIAPFRAIVEELGGSVVWDLASQRATATARGRNIVVTIGSDQATVDTGIVAMDAPAELRRDRTMVPLRFLGDVFGLGLRCAEGAVHIASAR